MESLENRQLLAADIQGAVYNDLNGNGLHDNGESGLVNWTVYLDENLSGALDAGEPVSLTDADGKYAFRGLAAGEYRVAEVVRTGWTATGPAAAYTDVTLTDEQEETVNFLNHGGGGTGVITGNVWRDINNNQFQDPEDTGLAGWTLYLDLNGNKVLDAADPFVETDGNGDYMFVGVLGGSEGSPIDYEVTEVVPAGWEPKDINITAAVIEGQVTSGIDFSNWPDPEKTTSISGRVYDDANGNGLQDGGEAGLGGWTVFADLNFSGTLDAGEAFATTASNGGYSLAGLEGGNVRVTEVQLINFRPTSPATGYRNVLLTPGVPVSGVHFGNQLRTDAAIGGVIFVDRDKDDVRDAGEEGLPGITVYLDLDQSGSLTPGEPSMVTSDDHFYTPDVDEAGTYRFEKLAGGTYVVRQLVPAELDSPGSEIEHTVTVGPADDLSDLELGDEYRPSEIHGVQFEDVNGNHLRDLGEPGIAGVTVFVDLDRDNLLDAGEPTTLTAADGSYDFLNLAAGAYVVREVVPDGYVQTYPETRDGILWPGGLSHAPVGIVSPSLIEMSLADGETHSQSVSLTLPNTGALTNLVDVFLLFDDTGSFTYNSPIVRAAFPEIIAQLQTRLPGINLGFGAGRLEEYGNFAAEYANGRPFVLNQPVVAASAGGYTDAEVLAAIQAALDHVAPGYGGDTPETVIEALYQMVTGAGFDGNNDGDVVDSGPAGAYSTQVTPGSSGDVPAFSSFTPDTAHGGLAPSGTIGGAGFRSGALPIIITATDTGFAYQPKGETVITGVDGLTVPVSSLTYNGRGTTPFDGGAGIQETVTGLNALGALVIGLGTNPEPTVDPRIGLEALASLTGAINRTANTLVNGTADPIGPNDPLYFMIGSGGDPLVKNIADGIVAAIEGAVTAVSVNVTLRASDPRVEISFSPGVLHGLKAGDTATFDVTFHGDGRPHRFDLQFVREGTDVVLGSIPVVIGTPIAGDGYEFEDCEEGEHSQEVNFGNRLSGSFIPNAAPSFTAGSNQSVDEDAGPQTFVGWATNISPGPSESTQSVDFLVSNDNNGLFAAQPAISADGTLTFEPAANAFGSATVTVRLHDDGGTLGGGRDTSDPRTFTINVSAVNDAPTATGDAYAIDQDTTLDVAAPGVLGNDADVDGDALSAVLVAGPAHGSLTLGGDGALSYTPDAGFVGTDSFTYAANDGELASNTVTVSITVNEVIVNHAPMATGDEYAIDQDTTLDVAAPGVLGSDADVDGDALSAVLVAGPAHGRLTLGGDGALSYTPDAGFVGIDSFTYAANDGELASNTVTVSITVNEVIVNHAPTATGDDYAIDQDTTLDVAAPGVLGNDADVDGDALSAVLVAGPAHGSLTLGGDGALSYTPDAGFVGIDSFTYAANDGELASNTVTVSITVNEVIVNHAPTATGDAYAIDQDTTLDVAAPGVLGNDADVDGDALSAVLVAGPAHGSLTLGGDGALSYTPDAGFVGIDSFTYAANDGELASNTVTVSITVNDSVPESLLNLLVVDPSVDDLIEYDSAGNTLSVVDLHREDKAARGVAVNPDGSLRWVLDRKGEVFVYDASGRKVGSWEFDQVDKPEGIAVFGRDLWIVDRKTDRVYLFAGAAALRHGHARPASSFRLAGANGNPRGLATDGSHFWVVDSGKDVDRVFRYSTDGRLEGAFAIDSANTRPTGVTIDPTDADHLWVVDAAVNRVFRYDGGARQLDGALSASMSFSLGAASRNPQGIAALPVDLAPTTAGAKAWFADLGARDFDSRRAHEGQERGTTDSGNREAGHLRGADVPVRDTDSADLLVARQHRLSEEEFSRSHDSAFESLMEWLDDGKGT